MRKELIVANVTAIVVNALLWLLTIVRVFPPVLTLLLFVLSVAGFILLSAKLNGLSIRPRRPLRARDVSPSPLSRAPGTSASFHKAPTEHVLFLSPSRRQVGKGYTTRRIPPHSLSPQKRRK